MPASNPPTADETILGLVLLAWLGCAFLGAVVGGRRNAAGFGLLLGLFFGPLGVLCAFALDGRPQCPCCRTRLEGRASVCPACHARLRGRGGLAEIDDLPEIDGGVDLPPLDLRWVGRFWAVIVRGADWIGKPALAAARQLGRAVIALPADVEELSLRIAGRDLGLVARFLQLVFWTLFFFGFGVAALLAWLIASGQLAQHN
jgi:hypothetical protein